MSGGEIEIFDRDFDDGSKGYRFRFKGGFGGAEHCKWTQFVIGQVCVKYKRYYLKSEKWIEGIDWHCPDWFDGGEIWPATADRNRGVRADGKTPYVDSLAKAGIGPGANDPGYVEGGGGGIKGTSRNKDIAEMTDTPRVNPTEPKAKDRVIQRLKDKMKEIDAQQTDTGGTWVTKPYAYAVKMRANFAAYLVCNQKPVAIIEWWHEFIYEKDKLTYDKGLVTSDTNEITARSVNDYSSVHKTALDKWNRGE